MTRISVYPFACFRTIFFGQKGFQWANQCIEKQLNTKNRGSGFFAADGVEKKFCEGGCKFFPKEGGGESCGCKLKTKTTIKKHWFEPHAYVSFSMTVFFHEDRGRNNSNTDPKAVTQDLTYNTTQTK